MHVHESLKIRSYFARSRALAVTASAALLPRVRGSLRFGGRCCGRFCCDRFSSSSRLSPLRRSLLRQVLFRQVLLVHEALSAAAVLLRQVLGCLRGDGLCCGRYDIKQAWGQHQSPGPAYSATAGSSMSPLWRPLLRQSWYVYRPGACVKAPGLRVLLRQVLGCLRRGGLCCGSY